MKLFSLGNGWKIIPKLDGDPEQAKYIKRVANEMRKLTPARPKPVKPDGMSQDEWILSMQSPATRELMEKHKDPEYKRDWTAPLPDNVLANPNATTKEELVGEREATIEEINHIEAIRRRSKNTLGQSERSGVSSESRARGAHAFCVSPPARLTDEEIQMLTKIEPIENSMPATLPEPEQKKRYPSIMDWITGAWKKK